MEKVLGLFKELLQFFKNYGDSRITPQYRSLQGAIEYLESDALEEDKVDCIKAVLDHCTLRGKGYLNSMYLTRMRTE